MTNFIAGWLRFWATYTMSVGTVFGFMVALILFDVSAKALYWLLKRAIRRSQRTGGDK
jgi:hypothetical protein